MAISRIILFALFAGVWPVTALAGAELVVHISCENDQGQRAQGSGVLISGEGHVLTAGHVVPDGYHCRGAVGSVEAEKLPLEPLAKSIKYDGMVLKFDATFETFARYCEMGAQMVAREIHVWGFHLATVGKPAVTDGIISTFELDDEGMFETSAESVQGKSGGPAFLKGTRNIVGIVGGVKSTPSGFPVGYMVTPADKLADIAPLVKSEECGPKIDGYTVEQHQAILEKRLAELRADLERAGSAEKEVLRLRLDAVLRDQADLQASFEAREAELRELRLELTRLNDGQVPAERLEAAQAALYRGETALADEIFAEIEEADAGAVKRVAAAAFGRGKIARDAVDWAEAYAHFEKAARLDPSYEHLRWVTQLAWRMGKYRDGMATGQRMLEAAKQQLGSESPDFATALTVQALNLKSQGLYDQAEPLYRQALEIGEATLGKAHPDYATRLNNLALLLRATGRMQEAEPLYREALETREAALGKGHPDYATSLNNLAGLLRATGRMQEAEPLYREALEITGAALGKAHPDYATSLNNLALLLRATGRMQEAEPLYRQALEIGEATVGKTHPAYATRLNNLAGLLEATGRMQEAEPLYREALEITGAALGKAHPAYATRLNNLANLLSAQSRFTEAEPLFIEALDIWKGALGTSHSDHTISVWSLAVLYWRQDRFLEADPLFEKVVPAFEQSLGVDHPWTKAARGQYEDFLADKAARSE